MAKRKKVVHNGPGLFDDQLQKLERVIRRQRALFIPHILRQEATKTLHKDAAAEDRAYDIAVKWAELETSGKLQQYKETSIDTQFLDQLFGEGLGYKVKTTSPSDWHLEHKFLVTGVGTADAALGEFPKTPTPIAMVELKGWQWDLDRDRSNGRTAVQQCWDYINAVPAECMWGIVSNFRTIRLYHREKGTQTYEEFSLQELKDRNKFKEFYHLFERGGLLSSQSGRQPRALELLRKTQDRQKSVGEELYASYQDQRSRLIDHLKAHEGKSLNEAIRIAQKLLDRIIFIAFCEKRGLLNENCINRAALEPSDAFGQRNPRWKKFLGLFREVDKGGKLVGVESGYNGGLFAPDPAIDNLELDDIPWTEGFRGIARYDFAEEVNVEVLGHVFERSITVLEKLRIGGQFALQANLEATPKSAERKRFGIYYTPTAFTELIAERTVNVLISERFAAIAKKQKIDLEARQDHDPKELFAYWTACLEALKDIAVCDPACGSGAFLIQAYEVLDSRYRDVIHGLAGAGLPQLELIKLEDSYPDLILSRNLFGVDLSREAVEITQLALWIRSARRGKTLADLSHNIVWGNSLVADDKIVRLNSAQPDAEKRPKAMGWESAFPTIFTRAKAGFDCVIGNPPWERMKLEEREFFAFGDSRIATAANAADRKKLIAALETENPELWERYKIAQASADRTLGYVRSEEAKFPLTAKGDINLYMLFAELGQRIVAPNGRVGLLLPSGIATDHSTQEFFGKLVESKRLAAIYDFVNRFGLFPDVEGRLKFCVLLFGGEEIQSEAMDFVFWAERMEDIADNSRHVLLSGRDIQLMNPNTKTCPIFRSQRDAVLTKQIYKRVPILIDESRKQGGNPWGIRFFTMFHQTNDAGFFSEGKHLEKKSYALRGNVYVKKNSRALPLLEAKMTREFDHRASWITMNPKNAYMNYAAESVSLVDHQNPEFLPKSRYWVAETDIAERAPKSLSIAAIGFHDVARANDTRTMVACMVPYYAYSNKLPLIINESDLEWRRFSCLLGNLGSYAYDFVVRQKVGGANLNFFIVEQIPTLPPDTYAEKCPWAKKEKLEHWISERVLKLSCTAEDMIPLAQACDFKGSRGDGVHIWKEEERAQLRAELDAAYFHLYGISREDAEYILTTFTNTGLVPEEERSSQQLMWSPGSPGERILEAYDRFQEK